MSSSVDSQANMQQILQAVLDVPNQALKITSPVGQNLNISAASDSITSFPVPVEASAAGTNATTGVVIPSQPVSGVGSVALFVVTNTTIVGPQALTVEVSPNGTDWVATSITVTPSTTAGIVQVSGPTKIAALDVRVSIASAITSGTFTAYLINGN